MVRSDSDDSRRPEGELAFEGVGEALPEIARGLLLPPPAGREERGKGRFFRIRIGGEHGLPLLGEPVHPGRIFEKRAVQERGLVAREDRREARLDPSRARIAGKEDQAREPRGHGRQL